MPIESHLHDALLFALIALALVLIALLFRSPARHTMLGMLIVTAVGVLGLWVFENFGESIESRPGALLAREAGLVGVTFGVMYTAAVGEPSRRHWAWAVLLAVGIELAMLASP